MPTFAAVSIAVAVDEGMAAAGVAGAMAIPFTETGVETAVADGSIVEGFGAAVGDCVAGTGPAQPTARITITSTAWLK